MGVCSFSKEAVAVNELSTAKKELAAEKKELAAAREEVAVYFSNSQEDQATDNSSEAIALFPFKSNNKLLLSFEKGDELIIEDDSDPDWYVARHTIEGRSGFVLKTYLSLAPTDKQKSWFFADTNRADAERLLLQPEIEPGTFLVRHSHAEGTYALSLKIVDPITKKVLIHHYKIQTQDEGKFFMSSTHIFDSLNALVAFLSDYFENFYPLNSYKLKQPCTEEDLGPPILASLPNSREEHEVPLESLEFVRPLGKGNFGEVFYGFWNGTRKMEVAIKRFDSIDILRREVAVMKAVYHAKIVRLFAICTEREPFYIVMEYMCNGNLQQYLQTDHGQKLQLRSLVDISAQITEGMMYLEASHMIHGNLTARSILVGDRGIVKLADFGLARIMDEAAFVAGGRKLREKRTEPKIFTIKSDALSFGLVLNEIFTHGKSPYSGMTNDQVLELITKKGYRMSKPSDPVCTDAVYEIITMCLKKEPENRPTFEFLHHFFADFVVTSETPKREAKYGIPSA